MVKLDSGIHDEIPVLHPLEVDSRRTDAGEYARESTSHDYKRVTVQKKATLWVCVRARARAHTIRSYHR